MQSRSRMPNILIHWITFPERPRMDYRPQEIDVAALRKRMHMTQKQFSRRFGISLATLR